MKDAALRTGMRLRRRALGALGGSAIILTYHRVAHLERDPQCLAVTPELFRAQLESLARSFHIVRLADLAEACAEHRALPHRALALTFDDGYADNYLNAKPVLAAAGAPATIFVATNRLTEDGEMWWDELDRIILSPGRLPERLFLGRKGAEIDCGECTDYDESQAKGFADWCVLDPPPTPRHALYAQLCRLLEHEPPASRRAMLHSLREQAGVSEIARPANRHLSVDELRTLARCGLLEIGAHTRSHPHLATLPAAEQESEIAQSKAVLEEVCGCEVPLFSYPYGGAGSFTDETVAIVERLGFVGAVTTQQSMVTRWTDPLRIPRYPASALPAEDLVRCVAGWFGD